jgi:SAM-dependent methyltransferase
MSSSVDWYHRHASDVVARYEAMPFERVHDWLVRRLPDAPALVLDVGAGSGRDAAWFASRGDEVVAVEPAQALRELAMALHPSPRIRWVDDRLPGLDACHRMGLGFDVILASAVWMHVLPAERDRAFRKLVALLKPGGILAMTLRHGPDDDGRGMHSVSAEEIERFAIRHGAVVERNDAAVDEFRRSGVTWTHLLIRLPDDGTGAMQLLRHLIVNDAKSSSYKLALLRTLCRIADGSPGLAVPSGDERIEIPFGLVGLFWLRLFRPLLDAGLPQSPDNRGFERLGFVRESFVRIGRLSAVDLRVGARFDATTAGDLHGAIRDACDTIERMPVRHSTRPDGHPLFVIARHGPRVRPGGAWALDAEALWSFGSMSVPVDVWRCLSRFDVWVEPALVAEWARLMHGYAERQGRALSEAKVAASMRWMDPARDVRDSRKRALAMMRDRAVHCVWTGRRLSESTLDIDHCFPWTVWPCDALWNLMPAHSEVNRRLKRDRVPADSLMLSSRERIADWWDTAYIAARDGVTPLRFLEGARASLPGLPRPGEPIDTHDVFSAMRIQRMRVRFNQQAAEWAR